MVRVNFAGMAVGGLALSLLSAVAIGLLQVRIARTDDPHFAFLSWNLFLAWIPLALASAMLAAHRLRSPRVLLAAGLGLWLIFLPNAPYLVTDFIHLAPDSHVPLWFDFALLGSFAATGLLLGFASVYLVQVVVSERLGPSAGWTLSMMVFALSAVGIYIGRVLRFNSWDLLREPGDLLSLAVARVEDPFGNTFLVAAVVLITALLAAGYLGVFGAGVLMMRGLQLGTYQRRRGRSRAAGLPDRS